MSSYIPKELRDEVSLKKGGVCGICHQQIKFGEPYEIDHIFPESKGGKTEFDNLHVVHIKCNRNKSDNITIDTNQKWKSWVSKINFDKLRKNQIEAYEETLRFLDSDSIRQKLEQGGKIKLYCQSTGSGKTILILIIGMLLASRIKKATGEQSRILIINPTRIIRDINKGALDDALELGIIPKEVYEEIKINTLDKDSSIGHIKNSDIVISTYQKIGKESQSRLLKQLPEYIDIVLIDEGHHAYDDEKEESTTHQDILKYFDHTFRLLFTATPYKSMPRKEQESELLKLSPLFKEFDTTYDVIHDFSYADSWKAGYAKYPLLKEINLNNLELIQTEPSGKVTTQQIQIEDKEDYKQILKKISKSDFVRHPKAVELLLRTTIEFLNKKDEDLGRRVHNAALVVFRTKIEAINASKILEKITNKKPIVIYSGKKSLKEDMERIQNDEFDIILGVDLLKEGFNYKNISVISISRNIRSFAYFIQLLGRLARARKDKYGKDIPVIGGERIITDSGYLIYHEIQDQIKKYWDLFSKYDWKDITEEEIEEIEEQIEREIIERGRIIEPYYYRLGDISIKKVSTEVFDEETGRPEDVAKANLTIKILKEKGVNIGNLDVNDLINTWDELIEISIKGVKPEEVSWEKDNGNYALKIKPKKRSVDKIATDNINRASKLLQSQIGRIRIDYIQARWTKARSAISLTWEDIYGYRLRASSDKIYKIDEEKSKKLLNHLPVEIKKYENLGYVKDNFIPHLIKKMKEMEKW